MNQLLHKLKVIQGRREAAQRMRHLAFFTPDSGSPGLNNPKDDSVIGVNVALAQAGGPVRASEFRLPPLQLATSMRIDDSLADGLSFCVASDGTGICRPWR